MKDSKGSWYRQLNFPTTEFRWDRRKGPGLPYILQVRSVADVSMMYEYEVMDVATAPIGAYLRLAEGKIIEEIEKRLIDDKRKRSEQFDKSERDRQAREAGNHAPETKKEQLSEGQVREPERQAQGGATQEDDPGRDDEVQHDRLPDVVKKKRGRPRKDRGESRAGAESG